MYDASYQPKTLSNRSTKIEAISGRYRRLVKWSLLLDYTRSLSMTDYTVSDEAMTVGAFDKAAVKCQLGSVNVEHAKYWDGGNKPRWIIRI